MGTDISSTAMSQDKKKAPCNLSINVSGGQDIKFTIRGDPFRLRLKDLIVLIEKELKSFCKQYSDNNSNERWILGRFMNGFPLNGCNDISRQDCYNTYPNVPLSEVFGLIEDEVQK